MKYLYAFVLLLVCVTTGVANDYVYSNGYYWLNNVAYYRVRVGCCWRYYPANVTISTNNGDWRRDLLRLAEKRDAWEGSMRKGALEQKYFLEGVQALGLGGNFNWGGYGSLIGTGYSGYTYAEQGTAQYGVQYKDVEELYGGSNVDQHYNQSFELSKQAQDHGNQARAGHQALVQEEGSSKERVALVLAKKELLKALDVQEQKITRETNITSTVPVGTPNPIPVIQNKCVQCHNAEEMNGDIDMTKYLAFGQELKAKVQARLTHTDPAKRMPLKRTADGFAPGDPLSFDELVSFK